MKVKNLQNVKSSFQVMNRTYKETDVHKLNGTQLWRNSIRLPTSSDKRLPNLNSAPTSFKQPSYRLHATGDADTFKGRTYIALPSNLKLTPQMKKEMNIW